MTQPSLSLVDEAPDLIWLGSIGTVLSRLGAIVPARVTGLVFGRGFGREADAELVALVDAPFTMRMRLRIADDAACSVFVENPASLVAALRHGTPMRCVRILSEGVIASDETGALERLCARASEAVRAARPVPVAERMRAAAEPSELLAQLELRRDEAVVAQLLFAELLGALLRARLVAAGTWDADAPVAFDACRAVDPVLAGWVAVCSRRPFAADQLPAIRVRVAAVTESLAASEDIVGTPQLTVPPIEVKAS
jgi:hypothetical protein